MLPLISSLCAALFSRYIGRSGSAFLTTIMMFANVILTLIIFYKVSFLQRLYFIKVGTWIYSDLFQVDWGFYLDNLTVSMLLVVNVVSALVHLYSTDYMSHDPHLPRFMSYLSLFTFFMLILVTGDNFVILFLGWEGVGLCSYLLISFWYTRIQANKAAIKALVVNRVADFALTIGMVSIFFVFKSLDFHVVFPLAPFFINSTFVFFNYDLPVLTVICSLLFIGAMGKSAQIGLHTWLPDAMEGPTPVSALIHAATMVTAGVFLIIKCSPLFEYVPTVLSVITFVGATTAFFSATVGLVQNDIKKVIAYSTCSQLGYMVFACGLSNYHVSLFHLSNHAFFKALLFLSAGAIIHSLSNEQDMRKFGSLAALLPFTSVMLLIGSLSLMGFPFLTGFYSKDLILELALTKYTIEGSFSYCLGLITAFFTSFYSFRVFYLTFIYKNNSFRAVIYHVHELPLKMAISLMILSLGSIFLGYFAKDLFVGLGTDFWNHSIFILPQNNNQLDAEFFGIPNISLLETQKLFNSTYSSRWIKLLPFFSSVLAVTLVCLLYSHPIWNKTKEPKNSVLNLLTPPYFSNNKIKTIGFSNLSLWLKRTPLQLENVKSSEVNRLIQLYTPSGFLKEYEKKGQFVLPYDIDSPLTPSNEIISNPEYYYYQKLLLDIQNEKSTRFLGDKKSFWRELYRFLSYKWYFDAIYNELLNRPLLNLAYKTIFKSLDKGLLEFFGPYGFSYVLFSGATKMKRMQLGEVYYYAYLMITFIFLSLIILNFVISN
jgi:NADH-ubiquinone oxidoreductase chain 5